MHRENVAPSIRAGFFSSVNRADQAVRNLLAAGFSKDELAVICPDQFKGQFHPDVPSAEEPGSYATEGMAAGGVLGATLGGLALAAATIGTGGAALIPAATVLIGGGALAGTFGGLVMADGYDKGVGEYYDQAIQLRKIVVGVHLEGEESSARLDKAARILEEAGADFLTPAMV
jgi:hypothetical protein